MSDPTEQELVFSVIVPTHRRPDQLRSALTAIAKLDFPQDAFEVIVAADGLHQELEPLLDECMGGIRHRLVEQDQQGPGVARNAAVTASSGRWLAFTDDDCLVDRGWLKALQRSLELSPTALIGGKTTNLLADNVYAETSQFIHDTVYNHYNRHPREAQFLASNNLAARREDYLDVGGFDPAFRVASEDRELCDRWLWSGRPMIYEPAARIRHAHQLTLSSFCRQHFGYGRGAARYHRLRRRRGSGKLSEHLSFHGNLHNWLTPRLGGGFGRRLQMRGLLFAWQAANAVGFLWGRLADRT